MSSEPVIEARGLGKAYPIYRRPEDRLKQLLWGGRRRFYEEYWAVRDVNLKVGRGETVGIIGRNGSGKSTLLQMICGTLKPSAGELRARGRLAAMLELGAGFNPQFTGRENIHVGASVLGLGAHEIEARFDSIAAFADIGPFIDQPMKQYSSGMYARLAFAVCANVDADVLVVDEILSVGDAAFQQKCMRYLNRFRMRGTMLFVSHDSGAIVKLCDRVLWLEDGEVRGEGDAKEMSRLYLAAQAEEAGDDASRFRLGGRSVLRSSRPAPIAEAVAKHLARSSQTDGLVLDDDAMPEAEGGIEIESAGFRDASGRKMHVAAGGESVELEILCRARRALPGVVILFLVRDRLGQILFSDDTVAGLAPAEIPEGAGFRALFAFLLPYLASGPYAIESYVFQQTRAGYALLQRRTGKDFLHVQSAHPSSGLTNIAMRHVSLRVLDNHDDQGRGAAYQGDETCLALRA